MERERIAREEKEREDKIAAELAELERQEKLAKEEEERAIREE